MRARSVPLTRIFRMLVPNGNLRPARPHCAQEGDNLAVFPFLRINPFPSGRAPRIRVSGALVIAARSPQRVSRSGLLPHRGAHCAPNTASGETMRISGFHPVGARIARPHSTRPERRLHANDRHKPCIDRTPAPGVRRGTKPSRRYRKSNFSTGCGQICLRSRTTASIPRRG